MGQRANYILWEAEHQTIYYTLVWMMGDIGYIAMPDKAGIPVDDLRLPPAAVKAVFNTRITQEHSLILESLPVG